MFMLPTSCVCELLRKVNLGEGNIRKVLGMCVESGHFSTRMGREVFFMQSNVEDDENASV